MKIEPFRHSNVAEDGVCKDGGAVHPVMHVGFSSPTDVNDNWICVVSPRTKDGIVEGVTLRFDNNIEMIKFINQFIIKAMQYEREVKWVSLFGAR